MGIRIGQRRVLEGQPAQGITKSISTHTHTRSDMRSIITICEHFVWKLPSASEQLSTDCLLQPNCHTHIMVYSAAADAACPFLSKSCCVCVLKTVSVYAMKRYRGRDSVFECLVAPLCVDKRGYTLCVYRRQLLRFTSGPGVTSSAPATAIINFY